jgi:hypothetical protein
MTKLPSKKYIFQSMGNVGDQETVNLNFLKDILVSKPNNFSFQLYLEPTAGVKIQSSLAFYIVMRALAP